MNYLLLSSALLVAPGFGQPPTKPNPRYATVASAPALAAIFPVASIAVMTVGNYHGIHSLTGEQLSSLKQQLMQARFAGGLLEKPGHIFITMGLREVGPAKPGFVYASKGAIHFDGGTTQNGQNFSGTYFLPSAINFDNYR